MRSTASGTCRSVAGGGRNEAEQLYVRFCFPDAGTADAFRDRFGGKRMTYTPERARPRV
jgi:hypothetical protein